MARTGNGSPPASNIVIFDSSASSSTTFHPNDSILYSCRDGPQKLTGLVKRGRPRKGSLFSNISIASPVLTHHIITGQNARDLLVENVIKNRR